MAQNQVFGPLGQRLEALRKARGFSQEQVALGAKVTRSWLSLVEKGVIKAPGASRLERVAKFLGTSGSRLLSADGEALATVRQIAIETRIDRLTEETRSLKAEFTGATGIPVGPLRSIPILLPTVPAGPLSIIPEAYIEDYLQLPTSMLPSNKRLFALQVSGWSMEEAGIADGDLVVVDPEGDVRPGKIVVVDCNGESTMKRFGRVEDGYVVLVAAHPEQAPIRLSVDSVHVRGVVVLSLTARRH